MQSSRLAVRPVASTWDEIANEFESMFDRVLGRQNQNGESTSVGKRYLPTLDISETPDAFQVAVDLPGVKPEDVKVEVQDDHLVLSGKREASSETKEKNFHRVERSYGSFQRSILLPSTVDHDRVEASYDAGVLHVNLPKSTKNKPRSVTIKSSSN